MNSWFQFILVLSVVVVVVVTIFWLGIIVYIRYQDKKLLEVPEEIYTFFRFVFLVFVFFFLTLGAFFQDETRFLVPDLRELAVLETQSSDLRRELQKAQTDLETYPAKLDPLMKSTIAKAESDLKEQEAIFNGVTIDIEKKYDELIQVENRELPKRLKDAQQTADETFLVHLTQAQSEVEKEREALRTMRQALDTQLASASREEEGQFFTLYRLTLCWS